MKLKHRTHFFVGTLFVAWMFDFLFWKQQPGITISIYVLILVATGLGLAFKEGVKPAWQSLLLSIPILFFSLVPGLRMEPYTQAVAYLLTLALLISIALTLCNGLWVRLRIADWVVGTLKLVWAAISAGLSLRVHAEKSEYRVAESRPTGTTVSSRSVMLGKPILIGLLLAFPVVLLFGILLASADPVFGRLINDWIAIDRWLEYLWRAFFIITLAYVMAGIYIYALFKSQKQNFPGVLKKEKLGILGGVEAITIFACVNLLFSIFVGVQFHYFFGGQSNINIEGFTYAEYARRGFFEVTLVAALSLMLFLGLSALANRQNSVQRKLFSGLGLLMVCLVGIMLYSAFIRLGLYELAYGFSRLRVVTHIFMVWLGILLFMTAVLEMLQKSRMFASALLCVAIGFGVSLALINVDAFIVRQNIARTQQGYELDSHYLIQLSDDAVPVMATFYTAEQNPEVRTVLGAALACKYNKIKNSEKKSWKSYHISRANARTVLERYTDQLDQFPTGYCGER
jgi:hypothetical protein